MDILDDVKAKVEELTAEQQVELREWLDLRDALDLSATKSLLTAEQTALLKRRLAAPREYASDAEVRALFARYAGGN